jgi:hypothetical protein
MMMVKHAHKKSGEQAERMAEAARATRARGMPADDEESAGEDQREPELAQRREFLPDNNRGNQGDEQRHETGIECALVAGGCKAQSTRRKQSVRRASPDNDRGQSGPSEAVEGKTPSQNDRRQDETRHAEAQGCDIPGIQPRRDRETGKRAPARPDRRRAKAEQCALHIARAGPDRGRRGAVGPGTG